MLLRRLIFLMGFLSFSSLTFGGEIDSLKHRAGIEFDQRELGKIFSRLGWLHIVSDPKTAELYLDSALLNYTEIDDSLGIANSWYRFGVLNRFIGNYSQAADYMDRNYEFYRNKGDTLKIINTRYQQGVIYSLQGNYNESLEAYFEILEAYKSLGDSVSMGFTLNSIGIVFKNMQNYAEAEDALLRSISIHQRMQDEENLANAYGNLGSLYSEINRLEDALIYYDRAKELDKKLEIRWGEGINEMNMGATLMALNKVQEALPHLRTAHEIQETSSYSGDLAETKANLGTLFLREGELDSAKKYLEGGLAIEEKSINVHADLLSGLALLYELEKKYDTSNSLLKELALVRDSIYKKQNSKLANALRAEYGIDQRDRQLAQKDNLINEKESALSKAEQERFVATGFGVLGVILAFLIWLFYREHQKRKDQDIENLRKQKEITALEAYIQGEENERSRLAQDLHDGLNGDLSVVKYKMSSLDKDQMSKENEELKKEAINLIDKACEQVRTISHNLAPAMLKEFSLEEALSQYISSINSTSSVNISFQYYGREMGLDLERATVVFRMIQEMIHNIIRHSEATEALVQMNYHDDDLLITVEDNGKGFKMENINPGLGLKTIQSRVAYLNAESDLISNNEGTTYTISIPMRKPVSV